MRITKYTHACVRLEREGRVLVIDPGVWSEPGALTGADAVLVTHEHADHIDVLRLAGLGVPVYAPADANIPGLEVIGVSSGVEFSVADFRVRAVGGRHAFIYDGQPDCANLGTSSTSRSTIPVARCTCPISPSKRCWFRSKDRG